MDATKEPGLRLRRTSSVPRPSGEIIIVETTNGKMCMGFYCDSDASHNLYLTHVTIFSNDGRSRRQLRRCWIKSHMIRDICIIDSNENAAGRLREGKVTDEHRGDVYASEETWNNRAEAEKRCEDGATRRHEDAVTLSSPECSVNLARVTCDREESWGNDDEQWDVIDDSSERACDMDGRTETTLCCTGVHVWRHITPGGKSWDAHTVDSISDVDVMKAATDVHWGNRIIARNSKACHS